MITKILKIKQAGHATALRCPDKLRPGVPCKKNKKQQVYKNYIAEY